MHNAKALNFTSCVSHLHREVKQKNEGLMVQYIVPVHLHRNLNMFLCINDGYMSPERFAIKIGTKTLIGYE